MLFTKKSSSKDGLNHWCKACCQGIELEPEKPETEIEPAESQPDEPELEFSELKDFAKRFILGHLSKHGETVDESFGIAFRTSSRKSLAKPWSERSVTCPKRLK